MRIFGLVVTIFLAMLADTAGAQTVRQQAWRVTALARPALDGIGLAGLRLGQDEAEVIALLGSAPATGPSAIAERALRYEVGPGVWLDVHVGARRVQAVALTAQGPLPTSPQTARGIRLGMPVERVLERYGPATDGRLWYASEGVAFNPEARDAPADAVESILIFAPGTPAR